MFFPLLHNMFRDIVREPLLAVGVNDPVEFLPGIPVDDVSCRFSSGSVHPHVEGSILIHVGKPTLSGIQLERRNAQIQKNAVGTLVSELPHPGVLREYAGLEKDVVLVGVLSRIEIWDKHKWEESNTYDDMDEIAEHMADLGLSI